jgi:vacuolar-type H+-ATPase subunit H
MIECVQPGRFSLLHTTVAWASSIGDSVEKVEKILAAEEAARHVVAEARDEAVRVRAAAESDARGVLSDAQASAAAGASEARSALISAAEAESRSIRADAEKSLGESLKASRGKVDAAVGTLVEKLAG